VTGKSAYKSVPFIHLDGWTVHCQHISLEVGDPVVYFEIDSFLPASDGRYWDFMANPNRPPTYLHGQKGYRVSSVRIGPKISQGRIFRLEQFPEIRRVLEDLTSRHGEAEAWRRIEQISFDEQLNIKKWVPEMDYSSEASIGKPPACILQPAWERCQNIKDLFALRRDTVFQITEKLDGLSMSVYLVRQNSR
jgi:RNA ligase (TIGR02306 family)